MDVFERLKRLQGKKKQMPSPLRQVVELHITQQDTDDDALKKKLLQEALSVFHTSDQTDTVVSMLGLYLAMEQVIQAQGLEMHDLAWMGEQGRQQKNRVGEA